MVSILVVVIACTLFYCVYCWRWRKRNGELQPVVTSSSIQHFVAFVRVQL